MQHDVHHVMAAGLVAEGPERDGVHQQMHAERNSKSTSATSLDGSRMRRVLREGELAHQRVVDVEVVVGQEVGPESAGR